MESRAIFQAKTLAKMFPIELPPPVAEEKYEGGEAHRVHPGRALGGVRHVPGPQDLPRGARDAVVQRRQAGVHPEGTQVGKSQC